LGTPAYMPPEQARGEVDQLDERCDVFALGAMLCEILTGRSPYADKAGPEMFAGARRGDHGGAPANFQVCSGAELGNLATQCLAAQRDERPRDAGVLAKAISAYLAGVQERLKAVEIERAAAETRATEERKTREAAQAKAAAERRARWFLAGLAAVLV